MILFIIIAVEFYFILVYFLKKIDNNQSIVLYDVQMKWQLSLEYRRRYHIQNAKLPKQYHDKSQLMYRLSNYKNRRTTTYYKQQ